MRIAMLAAAFGALVLAAPAAFASKAFADDDPPPAKVVRLAGTGAGAAPAAYVLDLRITPGDSHFEANVSGWAAVISEGGGSGEVTGQCVETHCALTFRLGEPLMELSADLSGAGPTDGRYIFTANDDSDGERGTTHLTPIAGPIPKVGLLSAPDAISAPVLAELLLWNGQSASFGSTYDDPKAMPDSSLREALAGWQAATGRASTGLITDRDIADLRAGAEAAKKAMGWAPLGDKAGTWRAGYPQALLPTASKVGRENRYASADGKAMLVIALEPAMTEDAFDALVDKETADNDAREHVNYTRSNGDFVLSYEEKGVFTLCIWHLREGGLARLVLRYPADQEEKYGLLTEVLTATFAVTDDFKTP